MVLIRDRIGALKECRNQMTIFLLMGQYQDEHLAAEDILLLTVKSRAFPSTEVAVEKHKMEKL